MDGGGRGWNSGLVHNSSLLGHFNILSSNSDCNSVLQNERWMTRWRCAGNCRPGEKWRHPTAGYVSHHAKC